MEYGAGPLARMARGTRYNNHIELDHMDTVNGNPLETALNSYALRGMLIGGRLSFLMIDLDWLDSPTANGIDDSTTFEKGNHGPSTTFVMEAILFAVLSCQLILRDAKFQCL